MCMQAIGVDDNVMPCGTVLEAAKSQGFRTGLVVTSRITHVWSLWHQDELREKEKRKKN